MNAVIETFCKRIEVSVLSIMEAMGLYIPALGQSKSQTLQWAPMMVPTRHEEWRRSQEAPAQ